MICLKLYVFIIKPSRQSTADLEPVSVEERLDWFNSHNAEKRPLWIVILENKIVGWISLTDFYGRVAYSKTAEVSIYVDMHYRGHRLGYESLTFVESNVKSFNIETVLSFIFGHNTPSISLFKKFGYEQWAFMPSVAEMDNIKRDLVILGKKY